MVVVDANVLLYAVNEASAEHEKSRSWLDASLGGKEAVGFAWQVLLAFLRIATSRAIFAHPLSVGEAADQIDSWLAAPAAVIVNPTLRHTAVLRGLLAETETGGNLTNDAHLAALALEHRADIVSFDRDFGRFTGVRHRLPD